MRPFSVYLTNIIAVVCTIFLFVSEWLVSGRSWNEPQYQGFNFSHHLHQLALKAVSLPYIWYNTFNVILIEYWISAWRVQAYLSWPIIFPKQLHSARILKFVIIVIHKCWSTFPDQRREAKNKKKIIKNTQNLYLNSIYQKCVFHICSYRRIQPNNHIIMCVSLYVANASATKIHMFEQV